MNPVLEKLFRISLEKKIPQGFLFVGFPGCGKTSVALEWVKFLFCAHPTPKGPCQTCPSCIKVTSNLHPDLFWVQKEKKEIVIEQIRDFQKWISIRPSEAPQKVGMVKNAEALNRSASNALLKTLEEPPPHAILILFAREASLLLPTIRSRLMLIRFPMPPGNFFQPTSEPPSWANDLESLFQQPRPIPPQEIFQMTEQISKDREQLPWFFWFAQKKLREEIEAHPQSHSDSLFQLALQTENELLRRYANVGMGLDRFLLQWLSSV